jgi:cell division protein FtsL
MSSPMGAVRSRVARLRPETRSLPRLAVVQPRMASARSGPFVLLVAAILVIGLVGLLLLNLSMQKGSFRLAALESEASHLQTREQSLDMKVDRLSSSDRLADEAMRMGMVPNRNPVFLDLSDGSVIGDPVAARPRAEPTQQTAPPTDPSDTASQPQQPESGDVGQSGDAEQTGDAQQPTERR